MTSIRCDNVREEYTIDIEGHAGFNPGNDIVCAGASVLGITLINALANQDAEIKNITTNDGEIHIQIKGTRDSRRDIKTIIETIMLGYELMEEEYPANINVEW